MHSDIIALAGGKYVNAYAVHLREITKSEKSSQSRGKKIWQVGKWGRLAGLECPITILRKQR